MCDGVSEVAKTAVNPWMRNLCSHGLMGRDHIEYEMYIAVWGVFKYRVVAINSLQIRVRYA